MFYTIGFDYLKHLINYQTSIEKLILTKIKVEDLIAFSKFILSNKIYLSELFAPVIIAMYKKSPHEEEIEKCFRLLGTRTIL